MALLISTVNTLGTRWGLFRHYWVVAKLALTEVRNGDLGHRNTGHQHDMARIASPPIRELPGSLVPLRRRDPYCCFHPVPLGVQTSRSDPFTAGTNNSNGNGLTRKTPMR
ncbi:hypothetical protein HBB16_20805 [Pseudonocardia sp. MCCB 268]|nr:hypothetical protein [Pseudonocardia cytotoxica]